VSSPARRLRSRPYRDSAAVDATSEDGVSLAGARVGRDGTTLVFLHGLLGWHRKERIVRFVETLSRRFVVYAFDLRGHGASGGASTYGALEVLDVEAAVARARADRSGPVVTMGLSMGGVAVIRHAALRDGVDAVIAVSAPARWDGHPSRAVARLRWLGSTAAGRRVARSMGVRLGVLDRWPGSPEEVVGRIAPTPLILVHGRDDHFFDEEEAWRLYRRAGEPKRLMLATRFGHAEDGLTARFADRLADRISEILGR
jgi:alpha-beta hydrolase superfamily lysophospholipase